MGKYGGRKNYCTNSGEDDSDLTKMVAMEMEQSQLLIDAFIHDFKSSLETSLFLSLSLSLSFSLSLS